MEDNEFKSFHDIIKLSSKVTITEKIHGTNAQVLITEECAGPEGDVCETFVRAGSRTRWLTPEHDNFGFALWVEAHRIDLIQLLGLGRHYGEWWGSGINSGYGLKAGERKFSLFHQGFLDKPLPAGVSTVPILYSGPWHTLAVEEAMERLRCHGSLAAPGFTNPEGVVVRFEHNGAMFKHVFDAEESAWQGKIKEKQKNVGPAVDQEAINSLLQPIRLEKLLSRAEAYTVAYPESLPAIVKDYVIDMEKEHQFDGVDPMVVKRAKQVMFQWVKQLMKEKGFDA